MKTLQIVLVSFLFSSFLFAQHRRPSQGAVKVRLMEKADMLFSGAQGFSTLAERFLKREMRYMDSLHRDRLEMKALFKVHEFVGSADAFWKVVNYSGRGIGAKEAVSLAFQRLKRASDALHSTIDQVNSSRSGMFVRSSRLYQEVSKCIVFVDGELARVVDRFVRVRGGSQSRDGHRGGGYNPRPRPRGNTGSGW